MVNWNDPVILARTYFDFIKLEHTLAGVYIWEYVTTLNYEWDFFARKRKWLWTVSIYSFCRLCCLLFTVVNLVGMNVTAPINCEAWIVFSLLFADLALVSASSLIVLRIAAIWERNIPVVALATSVWSVNVAFWLRDVIRSRSVWDPTSGGCIDLYTQRGQPLSIVTFSTDAVLLIIMLVGLLVKGDAARFGIWRMLYHQGLLWLVLAMVAELPTIILLFKNINDPWNLMFQTPALLTMVIGATRMFRALTNYSTNSEYGSRSNAPADRTAPPMSSLNFTSGRSGATHTNTGPLSPRAIEISVHREQDRDPRRGSSYDNDTIGPDKILPLTTADLEMGAINQSREDAIYIGNEKQSATRSSESL
ncbi:hypothetical protein BV25DRAFT_1914069 [Artomyces pyxidatus]|uniref:Uncharacterized protein n=1 Tax=Artomyces pyxidatus TaxID=48021 RepID=A0ACB8T8Y8_9AGAM|nr:hypothetical protein BV25DRAFT_1914069 [Artomyces pyxidatus]